MVKDLENKQNLIPRSLDLEKPSGVCSGPARKISPIFTQVEIPRVWTTLDSAGVPSRIMKLFGESRLEAVKSEFGAIPTGGQMSAPSLVTSYLYPGSNPPRAQWGFEHV